MVTSKLNFIFSTKSVDNLCKTIIERSFPPYKFNAGLSLLNK